MEVNIAEQILKDMGFTNPEHVDLVQANADVPPQAAPTPAAPQSASEPAPPALPANEAQPPDAPATPPAQAAPQQQPASQDVGALPAEQQAAPPATPPAQQPVELADEDLLMQLSKKLGREVKTLDELTQPRVLTPEEQQAQAEQRKSEAITFGLKEKLFTHKQMEEHAVEAARNPRETALQLFATNYAQKNPNATQDEINEAFSVWAFEHEPEDSALRKMRQDEIQQAHDAYITSKYANILNVEKAYDYHNEVISQAHAYKNAMDSIMTEFRNNGQPYEVTFNIGQDKHSYAFKVNPEMVSEVEKQFLGQNMFNALGKEKLNNDVLKEAIKNAIIIRELPRLVNEIAESHRSRGLLDMQAGRKNVPPTREHMTGVEPMQTGPTGAAAQVLQSEGF